VTGRSPHQGVSRRLRGCREAQRHVRPAQTSRELGQHLDNLCGCDWVIGVLEECERLEQVLFGQRVLPVSNRDLAEDV